MIRACASVVGMARPKSTQLSLLDEVVAMDSREFPLLGYSLSEMTLAYLPKRRPRDTTRVYSHQNAGLTLTVTAGTDTADGGNIGLPYGPKARLVIAKLNAVAVINKSPTIPLGASMNGFLSSLGLATSGGKKMSPRALVGEQVRRLVRCSLEFTWDKEKKNPDRDRGGAIRIAKYWDVWWDRSDNPTHPVDESVIVLSDDYFQALVGNPVPLNLEALQILGHSALAMDLYAWLSSRLWRLQHPVHVTWPMLAVQFGTGPIPDDPRKRSRYLYDVKRDIEDQMPTVLAVYHEAKVDSTPDGLLLKPSSPHVPPRGGHGLARARRQTTVPARRFAAQVADRAQPSNTITA